MSLVVRRAGALALALSLAAAGVALADTVRADADAVTPGTQSTLALGSVAPGAVIEVDVPFVLACSGTAHVPAGTTRTVTPATVVAPDDGTLAATDASIDVPADWPADGAPCTGAESPATSTPSHLRITAPSTAGAGRTFTILFDAGETGVTNLVALDVTMDVTSPSQSDSTPPTLSGLPTDIAATTSGASAVVTWPAPTATDDTDPAPVVACVPGSGSAFPVGTTSVTCTATDATGNASSASFLVTVTRTPAIVGTWLRPLSDGFPALVGRAGRTVPLRLELRVDGAVAGPGDVAAPRLAVDVLEDCAATAGTTRTVDGGAFEWADGAWQRNLDTTGLGVGCVRVRAVIDGASVAAAAIRLVPEAPAPQRGHTMRASGDGHGCPAVRRPR